VVYTSANIIIVSAIVKPGQLKMAGLFYYTKNKANKMKLIVIVLIVRTALALIESKLNNRSKNF